MMREKDLEQVRSEARSEFDRAIGEHREEIRDTIARALAGSITGRVEAIITEALSGKVAQLQRAQAEAEGQAEEARQVRVSDEQRSSAAQGQLKDLKAEIAGEKSRLDDLRINTVNLAERRDKLAAEVASLERDLKDLSASIAEKKISQIGQKLAG